MYWDLYKQVKAIQRRMVCRTRAACFVAATLLHLLLSVFVLLWQTSCADPRCVTGLHFDIVRAAMHVPLFVTPWLGLPSPDAEFHPGVALFAWLAANAAMAVLLYSGVFLAVRRGYHWWQGRRRG